MSNPKELITQRDAVEGETVISGQPEATLIALLRDPQAVESVEKLVSSYMDRSRKNETSERWLKGLATIALIGATTGLSVTDTMTPSAGVIFGALAGYIFGRGLE